MPYDRKNLEDVGANGICVRQRKANSTGVFFCLDYTAQASVYLLQGDIFVCMHIICDRLSR